MTSKTSGHRMTTAQWGPLKKNIDEYAGYKGKKEEIGKLIQKSQSDQAEAREGQAECAVTIKNSTTRIETSQKIQSKAKENLKVAEEKKTANNEIRSQLNKDSADGVAKSKTSLIQLQGALLKMSGSEALLIKAQKLITHTETLGKTNSEGGDVIQALIDLQASIRELTLEAQSLNLANRAKK